MKRIHRLLNRPERPHAALTPAFSAGVVIVLAAVALAAWQPHPDERPQEPQRKQGSAVNSASPSPYFRWLNEDVTYIIMDEERSAFLRLPTNEEREHFIEQFWLRRDPTPGTPANEFKEEHYRRIAYSNEHFSTPAGQPGWKTDLGRIYITYGPPDELEQHPNGGAASPNPYIDWKYRYIQDVGSNVMIEFVDQNRTGDYRMTNDPTPAPGSVNLKEVWTDTVKRGTMVREVRGLGQFDSTGVAEIRIAETMAKDVSLGKTATVDFRGPTATGRVSRIDPTPANGTIGVTIQLDAPPSFPTQPGQQVDASIHIETLNDVVYVGRPVFGQPNSSGILYKIEPDGQHATAVPVQYGRTSVNSIEVRSGLVPGDKVILSDMTRYTRVNRVQLK